MLDLSSENVFRIFREHIYVAIRNYVQRVVAKKRCYVNNIKLSIQLRGRRLTVIDITICGEKK